MQNKIDIDEFFERKAAKKFSLQIVIVCGLLAAIEAMDIYVLGVIISPMSESMGVSLATFAIVFTFQAVGQIIGTYLIAPLADKFGRRPIILWCTLAFGILTITSAFSPNLTLFIAQRSLAFLLIGGAVPNIFSIASEFGSKRNRRRNTLIIGSFHGIGAGMAFLLGGLLLDYGWHVPLIACGILTILSFVLAYYYMPESIRFLMIKQGKEKELSTLLTVIDKSIDPSSVLPEKSSLNDEKLNIFSLFSDQRWMITALLWIIGGFTLSMIGAVAQWTPTYLHTYGGVSLKEAAIMTSLSGPAGIIWPIVLIWLMNKMGPSKAMALNYLFAATALGSFVFIKIFPDVGWLIAFGYGAFLGGATSGFYTLCTLAYPTAIRATGTSLAVGAGRLLSLVAPLIAGYAIHNTISPTAIALALITPLCIVMIATLFLGKLLAKNKV